MQPSFIFSSICIFRCVSLPLRLLKLAAAWGDSKPHRMPASSWKSPGAESSVFLTLSYLEHRFALLVIFWHLWITVMLSYLQLQSSRWERSQLLEALSMGKKKSLISALFIGNATCESIYFSFWDAGNDFNRQCIILLFTSAPRC